MDTGHGRHRGHLQLEGKPRHGECLRGWYRCRSRCDLLLRHRRYVILCLLSIVPFVIRANVKHLTYSSIYVFKRHSSSAGRYFIDEVLNMGGSGEGEGTCNDAITHDRVVLYVMYLCRKTTIMYCCEDYGLPLWYIKLPQGRSQNRNYVKKKKINMFLD
jgi:hypothetical protein